MLLGGMKRSLHNFWRSGKTLDVQNFNQNGTGKEVLANITFSSSLLLTAVRYYFTKSGNVLLEEKAGTEIDVFRTL